jgi:hypothetical protein
VKADRALLLIIRLGTCAKNSSSVLQANDRIERVDSFLSVAWQFLLEDTMDFKIF